MYARKVSERSPDLQDIKGESHVFWSAFFSPGFFAQRNYAYSDDSLSVCSESVSIDSWKGYMFDEEYDEDNESDLYGSLIQMKNMMSRRSLI